MTAGLFYFIAKPYFRFTPDWTLAWELLEKAGGIRIGQPQKQGPNHWKIPLQCDISATHAVIRNISLTYDTKSHKPSLTLALHVNLPLSSEKNVSSQCWVTPEISNIPAGSYPVFYTGHPLGLIHLPE